jgi:molybdate transport system ATP-binding protein
MLEFQLDFVRPGFVLDVEGRWERAVTGVFGPSGAGKTTFLHLLAGLAKPSAGTIRLDGHVLVDTARGVYVPPNERRVAVVFQDDRLFPHMSVRRNLAYGRRADDQEPRFDAVVDLLELEPFLERRPEGLSGGERQRVALGRALLSSPRLLLCDEPLSSLDQRLKGQILPFLRRVQSALGIPTVYVSHDLREILQLTTWLCVMDRGRVTDAGEYHALSLRPEPSLSGHEVVNVLEVIVNHLEPMAELEVVSSGGATRLFASPPALDPGSRVFVSIDPDDIALARERVAGISIQNQLPGRVTGVSANRGQALVEIDAGVSLLARVTEQAVRELDVRLGARVWCLVKAAAISYLA